MTDAECQEAMDKGEMVRYVGGNPRLSGQTGRIMSVRACGAWVIGQHKKRWSVEIMKSTVTCLSKFLERVVAASASPPVHPFQVGDSVIYTDRSNGSIPYGATGTVTRLLGNGVVDVDIPVCVRPPGSGTGWLVRVSSLTPVPGGGPPVPQVISVILPVVASWTGDEKLTIHRSQSAAPPHYPHVCPTCKAPAYIGFSKIDCSAGCP